MDVVHSINGVPIRLTEERWEHIVSNKPYMEPYSQKVLVAIECPHLDSERLCWGACSGPDAWEAELSSRDLSRSQPKGRICDHSVYRSKGEQEFNHMAKEVLEKKSLEHLLKAVSHLIRLPKRRMRLDYDEEADVLYVHFRDKVASTHSEMQENGVVLDYRGNALVGVTVLEASRR